MKELEEELGYLSEDPYGKGWMIKMKIGDPDELNNLIDKATYDELCRKQKGDS